MSLLSEEQLDLIMRDNNPLHSYIKFARAIEAAVLEAQGKQEPVGYFAKDERDHYEPIWEEVTGPEFGIPLYAAPVVQPDMVLVPREPTEAMLDAPEVRIDAPCFGCGDTAVTWGQLAEIYRAMIAAAEGKK